MRIIDKSRGQQLETYKPLDVIAVWHDCDMEKQFVMLVDIQDEDSNEEFQAILLHDPDNEDDEGSNNVPGSSDYGFSSFEDLIADLKENYDHVKKVNKPAILVNGDN